MGAQTLAETVLVATLAVSLSYFGVYFFQKWKKNKIPTKWERVGSVSKIFMYPLKSGHRTELERAECTRVGLRQCKEDGKAYQLRDRELVVYGDKDGELRTARTYPKMIHMQTLVHDENHFAINAPGMGTLRVKIPKRKQTKEVDIKAFADERINGLDCGDEAAAWMSRYILEKDSGLRLAYNDGCRPRDFTKTHQPFLQYYKNLTNHAAGMFSDLASVHLVNQITVNDMNTRIADSTVTALNFRPNILIDGPDLKPYDEDTWDFIKIGDDVVLRNVCEGLRCVFTTINPNTAVMDIKKREPLATLEKYRKSEGPMKDALMGLFLDVRRNGEVKTGDAVYVARFQKY